MSTRKQAARWIGWSWLVLAVAGCGDDSGAGAAGGGGSPSTGGEGPGGAGGSGGEGGGLPAECDPRLTSVVGPECGLFVDAAAPNGGSGTQASPFSSLQTALDAAQTGQPIYVCTSPLTEAVAVSGGASVYGGLDCASWAVTDNKTPWTAGANEIPLRFEATVDGALLRGFAITAQAATGTEAGSLQGRSSIAAWVEGASVTLEAVDLVAGAGAAGGDGVDQVGFADGQQSDAAAFNGNGGFGCGIANGGGAAKMHDCGGGLTTTGGTGGDGEVGSGTGGGFGLPNYGAEIPDGTAGLGDDGSMNWSCASNGGTGEAGHDGPIGASGAGGDGVGSFQNMSYAGDAGDDGDVGQPGQGGGGGGGLRGGIAGGCLSGETGPSGGSGGAGGCGGAGGGGGGAGGGSFALVTLGGTLTLFQVSLRADTGGPGGSGGNSQLGGVGGSGANGGGNACSGGYGGSGGQGGAGGGGRGGPSVGMAFLGFPPDLSEVSIVVAEDPAAGGPGGDDNAQGNAGSPGLAEPTQAF